MYGAIVLLLVLAYAAVVGMAGLTAGLAALIVLAAGSAASLGSRVAAAGATALAGTVLTLLGVWAGAEGWTAALLLTVVSFCATLAGAYGRGVGTAAYLLNIWVLIALLLTASDHDPLGFGASFLLGGALAVGLIAIRGVRRGDTAGEAAAGREREAEVPSAEVRRRGIYGPLRAELRMSSPLLRFAAVRSLAAGLSTLIGWYLFPNHPYWAVLTAFVIVQTDPAQTVVLGFNRAVGTTVAVVIMVPLLYTVDNSGLLLTAFVVSGVLMLSLQQVNYALFTFFTTVVILLMARLTQGDAYETGWDRLLATGLGVALAFGVIGLGRVISRRRVRGSEAR